MNNDHDRRRTDRKLWSTRRRAIGPSPAPRCESRSTRNRFGGGVADEFIENYIALPRSGDAIITALVDGVVRGAAELRAMERRATAKPRPRCRSKAVAEPWVGSALLQRTLLAARNRGIKLMHMACLASNERMQQLARKFDAELTFDFGGVVGEVAAAHPTPLSVLREIVADSHGFATAMLDVQSRLLRPAASR